MKAKYLALAAALAFSTPVLAAAPFSDTQTANNGLFDAEVTFDVIANNVYKFDLSVFSSAFSKATGTSSVTATIFDSLNNFVTKLTGTTNFSNPGDSTWTQFTALTGGTYTLAWAGGSIRSTTSATATVSDITPVPGPEAGAGLGALALGGMALLMKRRRNDDVLAA